MKKQASDFLATPSTFYLIEPPEKWFAREFQFLVLIYFQHRWALDKLYALLFDLVAVYAP